MGRVISRVGAVALLGVCLGFFTPGASGQAPVGKGVYYKVLSATVQVLDGRGPLGTGWVVDLNKKWVVTNHHVAREGANVDIIFPEVRDGRVIAEREHYQRATRYRGRVLYSDPVRDLALIELEGMPTGVTQLKLAGESAHPGERVHLIGNSNHYFGMWNYNDGTVRQVVRARFLMDGVQPIDARVGQTRMPINPGDSGGPVVNDAGDLVGVNSSRNMNPTSWTVSNYIDVSEVRQFLADAVNRGDRIPPGNIRR